MPLPLGMIAQLAAGLVQGPLNKVLDAYISDVELRRKLVAELEQQFMTHLTKTSELGTSVALAEVQSEHWLTRSWRPILMLILVGFLVVVGFLIPVVDLVAGHPIRFEPRWHLLPAGFWDFLSIGMGGYIGGRSLEKVAGLVFPTVGAAKSAGRK